MTAATDTAGTSLVRPGRVLSVDILRGLTIAFMILVNDPGDWGHVFPQLDHAEWNGWTMTDLVFPTFLFLMGASMVFSYSARIARGDCWKTLTGATILRSLKILLIQFLLIFFPRMDWAHLRLFGVLPRIALCYLLAGVVLIGLLRLRSRAIWITSVIAALLVGYWVLLCFVPVPGIGLPGHAVPLLDPTQNMASWLDRAAVAWTQRWLHTGVLYRGVRDPEGLLSTLPAVGTTLLGALAGLWMRSTQAARGSQSLLRIQRTMFAAGLALLLAGELWSHWLPINKNLWTSSYVLLTAGIAAMLLAGLSWLVDDRPQPWPPALRMAMWPWLVLGSNAIVAYAVSGLIVHWMLVWHVTVNGHPGRAWGWLYWSLFARSGSNEWTSLAFAASFVVVCFLPNWWLWRHRWFLRV